RPAESGTAASAASGTRPESWVLWDRSRSTPCGDPRQDGPRGPGWCGARSRATRARRRGRTWRGIVRERSTAGKRGASLLGCSAMASIPAPPPVTLPQPLSWWQNQKTRRHVIAVAVLVAAYGLGLSYGAWTRVCAGEHCPSISRLVANPNHQVQTSKVYAADGRLISELGAERRTVLPLSAIPAPLRQAFIATEDKRFYEHHGIDFWRIIGAIKANVLSLGFTQGFSTITMQLARNIFPDDISREKTLTRKLKEARVAVEIERNFPKDTILQLYLNQINLGAGAHGVEAAAQIYFGKHARQLNVAEAATLAALPKLPAFYNPRTHPERNVRRRNVVLELMRDQGFLAPEECELWQAYPLVL